MSGDYPKVLDCGHPCPDPPFVNGAGQVAHYLKDDGTEETRCRACAMEAEKEYIRTHDRFTAYWDKAARAITDWHGEPLMLLLWAVEGRHNIGGTLWRLRARDEQGREWHGTSPAPGFYCRLRLCKSKK